MNNALTYKGYSARVCFDAEDRIFVGRIVGIRDVIGFHAETGRELETVFRETVKDYVKACAELGQYPQ